MPAKLFRSVNPQADMLPTSDTQTGDGVAPETLRLERGTFVINTMLGDDSWGGLVHPPL